jgi:hypothetical protein
MNKRSGEIKMESVMFAGTWKHQAFIGSWLNGGSLIATAKELLVYTEGGGEMDEENIGKELGIFDFYSDLMFPLL